MPRACHAAKHVGRGADHDGVPVLVSADRQLPDPTQTLEPGAPPASGSDGGESSLSAGAIAGIVIGAVLGAALLAVVAFVFVSRRRRHRGYAAGLDK